jgi:hypothetical protein
MDSPTGHRSVFSADERFPHPESAELTIALATLGWLRRE